MKLEPGFYQLTKDAYYTLFGKFHRQGKSLKSAFEQVEGFCAEKGCQNYYSSYESFKTAYYSSKNIGI